LSEDGLSFKTGNYFKVSEEDGYQLLISTDQNLKYQQTLSDRQLAIIILLSASWPRIQLRVNDIQVAVDEITPGDYREVPI